MKIVHHLPLPLILAGLLSAHPMGNSSVSHYSRFEVTPRGVELHYALDLAELPSLDLMRKWGVKPDSPREKIQKHADEQAHEWARNLFITSAGRSVMPSLQQTSVAFSDSADGNPTIRIAMKLTLAVATGTLEFEDKNYQDRAGWKEILIVPGEGVSIAKASHGAKELSQGLTAYPKGAPPQDLRAQVEWAVGAQQKDPLIVPIGDSSPAPSRDYLSTLLSNRNLTFGMMFAGVMVAFGLGAIHAMSPGHGKTIVAAYLVGSRGTMKHALFLGGMVTFTHTISVFLLGLATLFLSQYVVPDKVYPVLGAISGLSIVVIGLSLLIKRAGMIWGHNHSHGHDHDHHHHGPGGHTHSPEGDINVGSLIALGASGGLVPCPSALVLLLTSIAIGRIAFGLVLLTAFSLGLAVVLMAIGCAVLFAKNLLPESNRITTHPVFRFLPVASAAFIVCVGLVMTGVSLGWVSPTRF